MSITTRLGFVGSVFVAGLGIGCETNQSAHNHAADTSIRVEAPTRDAFVGDTLTFVARSTDTYGRDAKIVWTTTAGDVRTEEEGRIARITFNEPGTYSVRATLELNGQPVNSDIFEVRVSPVR